MAGHAVIGQQWAYVARKAEERKLGFTLKPVDISWAGLVEPLVHRGDEKLPDVLVWLADQQKKERPGA